MPTEPQQVVTAEDSQRKRGLRRREVIYRLTALVLTNLPDVTENTASGYDLEQTLLMRKALIRINRTFGKLRVVAKAKSDKHGNQQVVVVCECGVKKVVRATALTMTPYTDTNGKARRPITSCGCESKAAFKENWRRRALRLSVDCCRDIRSRFRKGATYKEIGARFKLPAELICAATRLTPEELKALRKLKRNRNSEKLPDSSALRLPAKDFDIPW